MSDFETRRFGDVTCIKGDCLAVMPKIQAQSVNAVIADIPYGVTQSKWDSTINLSDLWAAIDHVATKNCCALMTATQPFATSLINSRSKFFKYDIIWQKSNITGFFQAKSAPLRSHESILMFCRGKSTYNPQMKTVTTANSFRPKTIYKSISRSDIYGGSGKQPHRQDIGLRYPRSVLDVGSIKRQHSLHPTQKPVALLEWLIATYTNPGDMVLDPTAGSGTCGIAALNLGRRAVLIEKDPTYFEVMCKRIAEHQQRMEATQ